MTFSHSRNLSAKFAFTQFACRPAFQKRFSTTLKAFFVALVVLSSSLEGLAGQGGGRFPENPDERLTPGETCDHPESYRYPERIKYCGRHVDTVQKAKIIREYDRRLGYNVGGMNRGHFKIDHLIPLCAGGGNGDQNLWPQHKSIYEVTDQLEPVLCEKMAEGKLKQIQAIELVQKAKRDLESVNEVMDYLESL